MNTTINAQLHMFLSDSNLSYSAWGFTKEEAKLAIMKEFTNVGRLVYLGAQ
jgi:hypothetical protein